MVYKVLRFIAWIIDKNQDGLTIIIAEGTIDTLRQTSLQ